MLGSRDKLNYRFHPGSLSIPDFRDHLGQPIVFVAHIPLFGYYPGSPNV